jgi:glutaredoxin
MQSRGDRTTLTLRLILYSRTGCHLCDEMKATVAQVATAIPLTVEEIDIAQDPELERRYGVEIPVLLIEGTLAAKHRVTAEQLRRIITARGRTPA